jgi:hypothetical protein
MRHVAPEKKEIDKPNAKFEKTDIVSNSATSGWQYKSWANRGKFETS